jgi:hypothetical protein
MRNPSGFARILAVSIVLAAFVLGAYTAFAQTPPAKAPQKPTTTTPATPPKTVKAPEKPAAAMPKDVTLTGEVVDLHCYMMDPKKAMGPEHADCIRKGFPAGFVSSGQFYLIIGKGMDPAKEMLADMAGAKCELTGKLYEHNGVKAVELEKIAKVDG